MNGKSVFLKYWFISEPLLSSLKYYPSTIPGLKEGISGSMILDFNLGIVKNITEEKKNAAIEVIKFFTSKEYQKKMFESRLSLVAIKELWEDEELCKNELCDLIKEVQITGEPKFIKDGPEDYGMKYQKYIYQLLYENKSIDEVVKKINDITKIYYISLDTKDSYVGLIFLIFFSFMSILMILSLLFLFNDNFSPFFKFLPFEFWIVTVLGSIMILWVPFFSYGPTKIIKCHLKPLLLCLGYTFNLCPTLYKLISQFPATNKISIWVNKHKFMFLFLNILIDVLLNSISLINPYTSKPIIVKDGESFEMCKYNWEYSILILIIYKIIVTLILLLLFFVEWNISDTMLDLKFTISAIYVDILFSILIFVFYVIKIKYYIIYFIIQTVNLSAISISNYILLYNIRLILGFIKKQNIKLQFINNINEKFINNESKCCNNDKTYYSDNIYRSNTMSEYEKKGEKEESEESEENEKKEKNEANDNFEAMPSRRLTFISKMIDFHYLSESYNNKDINNFN